MKRISWFRRLFMTWDAIVNHINKESNSPLFGEIQAAHNELVEVYKKQIVEKEKRIEELLSTVANLQEETRSLRQKDSHNQDILNDKNNAINSLTNQISEIRATLEAKKTENENIKININEKLATLQKIETTFFAKAGNKGKGELGEMQVKTILEKSDLTRDMWVENLQVGSKNVEFAIKSADDGKWIPVDSKVLDAEIDEDNKVIIDSKYKARVMTQAKEISKYLSKANTAGYGLLVLQSDSIYIELYNQFPGFFQEVLRETKVHVASPSSFVQFAWSISQIVDIYERVKGDEKIFEDMISTLTTISDFANALKDTQTKFNSAMNKWMPSIEKKHAKLTNKLEKSGKIKQIKNSNSEDN